jgi:hypothetical protein
MCRTVLLVAVMSAAAVLRAQSPLEDKFFDSDGVRIRYVEAGRASRSY